MVDLRELLHRMEPALLSSLETSWTIAKKEWISALKMESESHAGLPHLESVEEWMNRIAEACRPFWSRQGEIPFHFNAVEIYISLCAALFHDIGRSRKTDDHGATSREIIEAHWAQLGLRDGRIAHELGLICAFHTSKTEWSHHDVTTIHPWGTVHSQAIASLLTLADELDTAYNRAVPLYLKDPNLVLDSQKLVSREYLDRMDEEVFTKGLYREIIGSVELDPNSHLIKTVLFNDRLPGPMFFESQSDDDKNKSVAYDWLSGQAKPEKKRPEVPFSPENLFFSYLEKLRSGINTSVYDLLARQYQRSLNAKRLGLLQDLRIPKRYPCASNLIYNLHLWDRQITASPRSCQADETNELAALQATVDMVKDTVRDVQRRIRDLGSGYRAEMANPPPVALDALHEFVKAYQAHRNRFKNPQPGELGKNGLEDSEWRNAREKFTPDSQRNRDRKSMPLDDAHRRLVDLLHDLAHFDLGAIAGMTGKDEYALYRENLRCWESWNVEDLHANLLLAFHVYLANVRVLWKRPDETQAGERSAGTGAGAVGVKMDCRYLGMGAVESWFPSEGKGANVHQEFVKNVSKLFTLIKSDEKMIPEDKENSTEDSLKALLDQFKEFRHHRKGYLNDPGIRSQDLLFAVRFMFMQWLSNDIRQKRDMLRRIQSGLQKLEIPFSDWLIAYNNHLFDVDWRLRIEPSVSKKTMEHLADCVFHLRTGIHTDPVSNVTPLLSWESLAAELRDPKIERVQTAANRLANLLTIWRFMEDGRFLNVSEGAGRIIPIDFQDLMLAEWSLEQNKKRKQKPDKAYSLETSHSGWRLLFPSDHDRQQQSSREEADDARKRIRKFIETIGTEVEHHAS